MEIYPDPTHVLLLSIPFFVAVFSVHFILWRPLLQWMQEREDITASAFKQADELEQAAVEHMDRIDQRIAEAHRQVGTVRQEARARAQAKEAEVLASARRKAEARIAEALDKIRSEQKAAQTSLEQTAQELSTNIASSVLGREVS
ncbi:MAG: ATP synthase F0 subunit B [Myxococcales bacterium]|nr:ATP synthase F0 subunit B [Myxococcales bacterium]